MSGIYGQDWASYQSAQPDTTGLSFAIIKVTEGGGPTGYVNPRWQAQRDTARAAGLVVGYYHYPHMGNSPQAEADRFLALVQPQAGELLVLDWEGYDPANTGVPHATQLAYKEAWLRYVKGKQPHLPIGMYCNTDYWRNVDTTGYYQDFLWIAANGAAGQPAITASWLIHQYGESNGVDLDYCHLGSTAELRSWALSFAPQVPPTPTPTPQPQEGDMLTDAQIGQWNAMLWGLKNTGEATQALVQAQGAVINTLAGLLAAQHDGVDTAQVVAAVKDAIAAAVVQVHVDVTEKPATPAVAP